MDASLATGCTCEGCQGLRQRYGADPELLTYYGKNLLQRGWAGTVDDVEKAYQLAHAEWMQTAVATGRENAARSGLGFRAQRGKT